MRVYQINVYDNNWKVVNTDYFYCDDRQSAEIKAETYAAWLGFERYEITRIR